MEKGYLCESVKQSQGQVITKGLADSLDVDWKTSFGIIGKEIDEIAMFREMEEKDGRN